MTDLVGRTLSHYRITSAIGAGGMGEVYRATDTTLGRDVAIKVLPPEVAQDTERLGRFRREAHLLASLNHPNIAAIYGLQEADGQPFIALELVEGEDLKERLARGAIPLDEALEIAVADRRSPRGSPQQGHRPSRPEARERQAHARRQGEGARLRPGESVGRRVPRRTIVGADGVAIAHPRPHRDHSRRDSGDGRLHGAGAGAWEAGGQAGGRVGVRRAGVGDADRPGALLRRHGDRRDRRGRDAASPISVRCRAPRPGRSGGS